MHTLTSLLELAKTPDGLQQIRVLVAELEGWEFWQNGHGTWVVTAPNGKELALPGTPEQAINPTFGRDILAPFGLPNYPSDLNEIVPLCREVNLDEFAYNLRHVLRTDMGPDQWDFGSEDWWSAQFANAPAHLRCIAYVLTKQPTKSSEMERAWFAFTDHEYYHRVRGIMLDYGMGEGDVEMILANVWENGFLHGQDTHKEDPTP